MSELICPFNATLAKDEFSCEHARKIIRRGGEEFSCQRPEIHNLCSAIHAKIRASALLDMGLEDDLLSLPHSVLVKIQFGALLGLQSSKDKSVSSIENVADLIIWIAETYPELDDMPFHQINELVGNYQLQKRRRKK
ncbi:MAG: hypothetical protein ACC707_07420 [Thiohalomonadales bacterium]